MPKARCRMFSKMIYAQQRDRRVRVCACIRARVRARYTILSALEIKFKINSELFAPLIERYPVTRLDLRRSRELELISLETKCER
jgi:hypothetical protein